YPCPPAGAVPRLRAHPSGRAGHARGEIAQRRALPCQDPGGQRFGRQDHRRSGAGPEALAGMDDEEIIARLTSVRGIGRWTAEMLLIFNLGRPDVLPVSDLGIRKGFMLTYGLAALPSPTEVRRHGARWAPYRTVASWYLWRANEVLP